MYLKKISSKIALAFLIFIIPSYFIIFKAFDFLASDYLVKRDRDQITNQEKYLHVAFEANGINGLMDVLKNKKLYDQSKQLLIFITDSNEKMIFQHYPEFMKADESEFLKNQINKLDLKKYNDWFYIPSQGGDEDATEIHPTSLANGYRFFIGANTDARDEIIENFRAIFFSILTPVVLISIASALFISSKLLKPISDLQETIKKIRAGQFSQRVLLPQTRDDLYDISLTFNEMISQIEALIRSMKDSLDNIAHDLRTPLTRSVMISEMAIQSENHEELKVAAEENIGNAENMLKLVNTIMSITRSESHLSQLNKESFDLKTALDAVIDLYSFVAEEKNIEIEASYPSVDFSADRSMFMQAMANLLDNAIKYSEEKSRVLFRVEHKDSHLIVTVQDFGIGISQDDLPRIWERLYRADRSRSKSGLGLGLSIVKIFVDSHNGKAEVISEIEKGTTFRLRLPV